MCDRIQFIRCMYGVKQLESISQSKSYFIRYFINCVSWKISFVWEKNVNHLKSHKDSGVSVISSQMKFSTGIKNVCDLALLPAIPI